MKTLEQLQVELDREDRDLKLAEFDLDTAKRRVEMHAKRYNKSFRDWATAEAAVRYAEDAQ